MAAVRAAGAAAEEKRGMFMHTQSCAREPLALLSIVVSAMLFAAVTGCGTPDVPVSYPCKNPDPDHLDPDGQPDPCHFEDPDSPAHAVTTFFSAVAAPFCEALYACCTDQRFLEDFGGSTLDGCKARWADGAGLGGSALLALKTSLVNGHTVFDQTQVDPCLARLNARLLSTPAGRAACVEPAPFLLLNTCLGGAFRGQLDPGATCSAWPGMPEDLSFAACKDGRCVNGKCVPFLKTGDACHISVRTSDFPDTLCNFIQEEWCRDAPEQIGICGPRIDVEDVCNPGNDVAYLCKSLECAQNHTCAPLTLNSTACDVF